MNLKLVYCIHQLTFDFIMRSLLMTFDFPALSRPLDGAVYVLDSDWSRIKIVMFILKISQSENRA